MPATAATAATAAGQEVFERQGDYALVPPLQACTAGCECVLTLAHLGCKLLCLQHRHSRIMAASVQAALTSHADARDGACAECAAAAAAGAAAGWRGEVRVSLHVEPQQRRAVQQRVGHRACRTRMAGGAMSAAQQALQKRTGAAVAPASCLALQPRQCAATTTSNACCARAAQHAVGAIELEEEGRPACEIVVVQHEHAEVGGSKGRDGACRGCSGRRAETIRRGWGVPIDRILCSASRGACLARTTHNLVPRAGVLLPHCLSESSRSGMACVTARTLRAAAGTGPGQGHRGF